MNRLLCIIVLLMTTGALSVKAQDKIYKTNGEVLEAKVLEIGEAEIKYKVFVNLNGPNYTLSKQQVVKVVYENGKTETYDTVEANIGSEATKRAQNVFVELGAQGLVFTANYDTRFGNRRDGLGARVGVGAISGDGDALFTIPVSLNYLLGNGKNFFEIGLGATYASFAAGSDSFFGSGNAVIGTMAFMYRLQPVDSGFSFRGGFTPIFTSDGFIPYFAGLSLGYTF